MNKQNTSTLLMIRPVAFHYNEQTAIDNHYQQKPDIENMQQTQEKALNEFNAFIIKLREASVEVIDVLDTPNPHTPDSIFPNNWISFHHEIPYDVILYPMLAPNRRLERRMDVIKHIYPLNNIKILDLTYFEKENKFLEGTGSMVLDREHLIAYASISQRTHVEVLHEFCERTGYKPVTFHSSQQTNNGLKPIYHTNVMMSVGKNIAVVCFDVIRDSEEKNNLRASLINTGKTIVEISENQVNAFAGNMLEVVNKMGQPIFVMSENAYHSLSKTQLQKIQKHTQILFHDIQTIELQGGGSARCMMCEVFKK